MKNICIIFAVLFSSTLAVDIISKIQGVIYNVNLVQYYNGGNWYFLDSDQCRFGQACQMTGTYYIGPDQSWPINVTTSAFKDGATTHIVFEFVSAHDLFPPYYPGNPTPPTFEDLGLEIFWLLGNAGISASEVTYLGSTVTLYSATGVYGSNSQGPNVYRDYDWMEAHVNMWNDFTPIYKARLEARYLEVSQQQTPQQFCAAQTFPTGTIGYFCGDDGASFYMCLDGAFAPISNKQSCASGTTCQCADGVECSQGGAVSPCQFFDDE
eukprot:TRINITY_DN69_c0_g1_i1.p1 TRINITY_DN69_c0_g1~~TRINITY_DN69_c0_g1_i1.p1  ORF type:complete len:279 (-),score=59.16 TRINITY_DN69_c0_g1_i1:118-918(-)